MGEIGTVILGHDIFAHVNFAVCIPHTGLGFSHQVPTVFHCEPEVMPIQTGANLLGNMFWQTLLGMKYYTKHLGQHAETAETSHVFGHRKGLSRPQIFSHCEGLCVQYHVFVVK